MLSMPETAEFTTIVRKNTRAVKKNTSCLIIQELLNKKDPLLTQSGMQCVNLPSDDLKAFLFLIPTEPETLPFVDKGFVFKERHLRVDKFYSLPTTFRGQNGYAAAHYTENYVKPDSTETITIHVYYTETVPYVQIKKANGKENIEWLESESVEKNALMNAFSAFEFYRNIEQMKYQRYFAALNSAEVIEKKIRQLSRTMSNPQQIREYLTTIDQFCLSIENINRYNEFERDCRDKIVLDMKLKLLAKLEMMTQSLVKVPTLSSKKPVAEMKSLQPMPAAENSLTPKWSEESAVETDCEFVEIKRLGQELNQCLGQI
ncbi:MAG: hypothetical protein M3R00_06560, partial [Pseudomonadota bacterium]|nr:hypothetical protein [Pseudomonadota bacterium]